MIVCAKIMISGKCCFLGTDGIRCGHINNIPNLKVHYEYNSNNNKYYATVKCAYGYIAVLPSKRRCNFNDQWTNTRRYPFENICRSKI